MGTHLTLPMLRKFFLLHMLCLLALLLVAFADAAYAQQTTSPNRGFQPGGAYAAGDIETINATNGNLMLRVPLGSLPPGRGGLAARVSLIYNSKLYDSSTEYENCPWVSSGKGFLTVNAQYPTCSGDPTRRSDYLQESEDGGWHYGLRYRIHFAYSAYQGRSADSYYNCAGNSHADVQLLKLQIIFPDGGAHDFRLSGRTESDTQQPNFFPMYPDGTVTPNSSCDGWSTATGPVTYYSTDGTYARLVFEHDANQEPSDNPWTLYLSDGTRVTESGANQRVYDRNNNYFEVRSSAYNGHQADEIADQCNRSIILEYGSAANEDTVHVRGFNNQEVSWKVRWRYVSPGNSYNTGFHGLGAYGEQARMVDRVILPNAPGETAERSYVFGYNVDSGSSPRGWGEVSSVRLPTGAQVKYQYTMDGLSGMGVTASQVLKSAIKRKDLVYQQEYDGASSQVTETWLYTINSPGGTSTITAPDGGLTKENFYSSGLPSWNNGLVYKSESPDGTVVERDWRHNTPRGMPVPNKVDNSYVKTEFTSIRNAAGALVKTAIRDFSYDKNGNATSVKEYDWMDYASVHDGSGNPVWTAARPAVKRETDTAYYNGTPDASDLATYDPDAYSELTAPVKRDSAAWAEVKDASGILARTEFSYDDPSSRGNLTEKRVWDSTKGVYNNQLTSSNSVSVFTQYDSYGNPVLVTDANGINTRYTYGVVGGFADVYPTMMEVAYGTGVQRTTATQYDYWTGLATLTTDVENNVSTSTSYDMFGRATLVVAAVGKPEETRTATSYFDSARRVVVRSDLNAAGDGKLVAVQHYDQLGRVRLTRTLEDASTQSESDETAGIKVQTRYAFGAPTNDPYSYRLVSNPYRAVTSAAAGAESTMGWSRTKADVGGHVVEEQTFGGGSLPAPWGTNAVNTGKVTTAYNAELTTVTDQAGKVRRSSLDSLGRLARVDESDPGGNLDLNGSPVLPTSYVYDALGNLCNVRQGAQTRTFVYDSLGRLTSSTNPESGTVSYTYDDSGNLLKKTDARGVVTKYTYDALNRNTTVRYVGEAGLPTPGVDRFYDGASGGKGRFWWSQSVGQAATVVGGYDALGRVTEQHQNFWVDNSWSAAYAVRRTYDRAGHVLAETYPSGHTTTYGYDAAGRLNGFAGNVGDGVSRTYSTGLSYSAFGGLQQEQFGTQVPLYHKLHYNSRGQLFDIRLSTSSLQVNEWDWNRGALVNYYSSNYAWEGSPGTFTGPDNNGNLRRSETFVPLNDQITAFSSYRDTYEYDSLNRLSSVSETQFSDWSGQTTPQYAQAFDYDRYGNRTLNQRQTWGVAQPQFDAADFQNTNRLYAPGDTTLPMSQRRMRYDAAGNLVYDAYTGQGARVYDAENRIAAAQDSSQNWSSYTYDSDGRRVQRKTTSTQMWQVYGMDGELLAEYQAGAAPLAATKEYGYRGGALLVTLTSGDDQRLKRFVTSLYDGALQRDPTAQELTEKTNQLAAAGAQGPAQLLTTASQIARGLFTSTNYETTGGRSDRQYTTDLYYAYLQRGPDDSGLNWWAPQATQSRARVCDAFETSSEFAALVSTLYGVAASDNERTEHFVNGFYLGALGRSASAAEMQQQRDSLNRAVAQGPSQVQAQAEALGRWLFAPQVTDVSISDQQYVTNLYEGFLQRGPDAGGLAFWTKMARGAVAQRQQVLEAFATCGSFRELSGTLYRETLWLVTDQLGTPRMVVDKSGTLGGVKRHDYLPFGEEIGAGVGRRTTQQGYSVADGVRQHYTSKERDDETGLDYFGYRYYASTMGRWTSVDPLIDFKRNVSEPQAWNQYQYCINNPLNRTDPDGQQDSAELNMNRDIKDLMEHRITEQEFRDRQTARGVGAAVGAAIVAIAIAGPEAATAILMWAARNPDKVEQIAVATQEAAGGPPGAITGSVGSASKAELSIAQKLAGEGKNVEVLAATGVGRTADFVVNGVKTELKTLQGVGGVATSGTVKSAIGRALGQSGNVIIDASGVKLTAAEAEKGAARAFGADSRLQAVRIIGKDFDFLRVRNQ
jgi:RHS repeat-associated protein